MPLAHKLKEAPQPATLIALLNQLLANTIDFISFPPSRRTGTSKARISFPCTSCSIK